MKFDPSKPYNDLPDLPPDIEFESKEVLRKIVKARAALAELKGISETIPNPELLLNSILLQEAKDSSAIENISYGNCYPKSDVTVINIKTRLVNIFSKH